MEQRRDIPVFVEKNYFAGSRFDDALDWIEQRGDREIHIQVTGMLRGTNAQEVTVEGRVLDVRRRGRRQRIALLITSVQKGLANLEGTVLTIGS
ncbi:MAG: hypothetical protein Q6361_04470, partial [Candidatus Hermodarchaeota archaeon]|nr:hypothetical protein [Candidatus Hermodarchaeota archaeon]